MSLVGSLVIQNFNSVREGKKTRAFNAVRKAFCKQNIFMVQHLHQAVFTHIAITHSINGVAELHIVCRDGFCNGTGSPSNFEKVCCYLLARTDLSKGSVYSLA